MNDEELTKTLYEKISEALAIQRCEQQCLVKNFRLVRVILPTELIEELRARAKEVVTPKIDSKEGLTLTATLCSVPVEEDKYATRIRYVIEGDLKFL